MLKVQNITNKYKAVKCSHSAWKMLIVGIPGVFGDVAWQCMQCKTVARGLNPFK